MFKFVRTSDRHVGLSVYILVDKHEMKIYIIISLVLDMDKQCSRARATRSQNFWQEPKPS